MFKSFLQTACNFPTMWRRVRLKMFARDSNLGHADYRFPGNLDMTVGQNEYVTAAEFLNRHPCCDQLSSNVPWTLYHFLHAGPHICGALSILVGTPAFRATAQTCGANAQSPIATDRPQITSSSIVIPCGSLQFKNGFQETSNGGQRGFDFPETSVRFGIAAKTELRLGVPDYFHNDDTGSAFANGFGDLSVGFKQQLGPTRGGFDVSVIPSVSLPTGANLHFRCRGRVLYQRVGRLRGCSP